MEVVSFRPRRFNPGYPLYSKLVGPQRRPEPSDEEKKVLSLSEIELRSLGCPAGSLIIITTTVPLIRYNVLI